MNVSAVKTALPTGSVQPNKTGLGAAGATSPIAPAVPAVTLSPPKLPGLPASPAKVTSSPLISNHAPGGPAPAPLSLVQEHKPPAVVGLPMPTLQPSLGLLRPEKKEYPFTPTAISKPTSNGVEGSPVKTSPAPPAIVVPTEVKKDEPAVNHTEPAKLAAAPVLPVATPAVAASTDNLTPPTLTKEPAAAPNHAAETVAPKITPPPVVPGDALPALAPVVAAALPPTIAPPALPDNKPSPKTTDKPSPAAIDKPSSAASDKAPLLTPEKALPVTTEKAPAATPEILVPTATEKALPAAADKALPATADMPLPAVTEKARAEAKPEFKVATTPRNAKRKKEAKGETSASAATAADDDEDRRQKRVRTRTQPYQSPIPEMSYITKTIKTLTKSPDDKLIVFYKSEFLAVRNSEGGFYICQAMQNIYKSSPRIRIRWLSQEKKDGKATDVYVPDFYDQTDFDCILTNLAMKKMDKNRFQLPVVERDRTQNILKRALDVEKGVSEKSPVTEEHPDGLDLSLFRDESQLKKRKKGKRGARKEGVSPSDEDDDDDDSDDDSDDEAEDESSEEEKKKIVATPVSKKAAKPKAVAVKEKVKPKEEPEKRLTEREKRAAPKRRGEAAVPAAAPGGSTAGRRPPPEKRAKPTPPPPARTAAAAKKPEAPAPTAPSRATNTRSVRAAPAKAAAATRSKEPRKPAAAATKGRKK